MTYKFDALRLKLEICLMMKKSRIKVFFLRNSSFNRETFIFIKIFIQRKLLSVCDDTCLHFVSNIVLVFFYALIRYTDLPKQKKICCFFLQISKKMFQEKE